MARSDAAARARKALLAVAVCCATTLAAACSSATSPSSGDATTSPHAAASSPGVAYAGAQVAQFATLRTGFPAPGPAFTAAETVLLKSRLSGKTVWFIPIFQQASQFTAEIGAFDQALALAGAKVHVCDAQDNPSSGSQCIQQAVSSGAAGIVTSAIDYAFAKQAFRAAMAAKVPLVLADDDETGLPASPTARELSVGSAYFGRLGADWVIADSNGRANVLYAADEASSGAIQQAAAASEFAVRCPGCKVTVIQYNDNSLSKLTTAVSTALVSHPDIDYVFCAYDEPGGINALQGVKQVSSRKVKFVAGGGAQVGLQRIEGGQESASPGVDTSEIAWNMADALFRFIVDAPQVPAYPPALRLFTTDNLPQDLANTSAYASGSWYSNGGYRAMYAKLWGVSAS